MNKESAMLDRFVKRMEEGLTTLSSRPNSAGSKTPLTAYRRLGRLQENGRAAAASCRSRVFAISSEERTSLK